MENIDYLRSSIRVDDLIRFIDKENTAVDCGNYDRRACVLKILRENGFKIGFTEEDWRDFVLVGKGVRNPDAIHCASKNGWIERTVRSLEYFLDNIEYTQEQGAMEELDLSALYGM